MSHSKNFSGGNFYPTKFNGYYISEDGQIWTEWHTSGNKSWKGKLKRVPEHYRGGDTRYQKFKGGAYKGINISIKDNTGKNLKRFRYSVHRLIAETLIENPLGLSEVDHIDRNKENNHPSNLRWCDRKTNRANR
jgi:hypothetical protein